MGDTLSKKEIRLIEALAKSREKAREEERMKWNEHYDEELNEMYRKCVKSKLDISFEDFIDVAYECSNTNICRKSYKRIRPLI